MLSLSMALCLIPGTVFAAEGEGNVAKIGEQTYATVDAAIEAAKDGDTITLLQDVTATKNFLQISYLHRWTHIKYGCVWLEIY